MIDYQQRDRVLLTPGLLRDGHQIGKYCHVGHVPFPVDAPQFKCYHMNVSARLDPDRHRTLGSQCGRANQVRWWTNYKRDWLANSVLVSVRGEETRCVPTSEPLRVYHQHPEHEEDDDGGSACSDC